MTKGKTKSVKKTESGTSIPIVFEPPSSNINRIETSHFDNLHLIPLRSHFKRYLWKNGDRSSTGTTIFCDGTSGNYYKGETVLQGVGPAARKIPSGHGKYFSRNLIGEIQYFEGIWDVGNLAKLASAEFQHNGLKYYLRTQKSGILLALDDHDFLARIETFPCKFGDGLDFSQPGHIIAKHFLTNVEIETILHDSLLMEAQAILSEFNEQIQSLTSQTTNNLKNAEDVFQLAIILKCKDTLQLKFNIYEQNDKILKSVSENSSISQGTKKSFEILRISCDAFKCRSQLLSSVIKRPSVSQLYELKLLEILSDQIFSAVEIHKKTLLSACPPYGFGFPLAKDICTGIDNLSGTQILCLGTHDIELFHDLCKHLKISDLSKEDKNYLMEFLECLVTEMFQLVKSMDFSVLREVAPLTNPIFLFLFKSFMDLLSIFSAESKICIKDLFSKLSKQNNVCTWGETVTSLIKDTPLKAAYTAQFMHIFQLLIYKYKPGNCSRLLSKDGNELWNEYLHVGLQSILNFNSQKGKELSGYFDTLEKSFITHIQLTVGDQRFENYRILVSKITLFAAESSKTYFGLTQNRDRVIFKKYFSPQLNLVERLLVSGTSNTDKTWFSELIHILYDFWEQYDNIKNIENTFSYGEFTDKLTHVSNLIRLLYSSSVKLSEIKKVQFHNILLFLKAFNEFIRAFGGIQFCDWYIHGKSIEIGDIPMNAVAEVPLQSGKKAYKVLKPEIFLNVIRTSNKKVPPHYAIEVVTILLTTLNELRNKNERTWDVNSILSALAELLTAISQSLNFDDLIKHYEDFDLFLSDRTHGYREITRTSVDLTDFKKRLGDVERYLFFTRMQSQVSFSDALHQFKQLTNEITGFFNSEIDEQTLQRCYDVYDANFKDCIKLNNDLKILENVQKIKHNVQNAKTDIQHWTTSFKSQSILKLLAGLSALWSVQHSRDVDYRDSSETRRLVPHTIQILCVFRLLGVDSNKNGVESHIAQILTGQGKSIVLGLLSACLAILGYNVRVVCYSEYLAKRDESDFKDFFKALKIEEKIQYSTFKEMAEECLKFKVNNGNNMELRELVRGIILDTLKKDAIGTTQQSSNVANTILLIDEVDVFFTKQFYGETFNPVTNIFSESLALIQEKIWKIVSSGCVNVESVVEDVRTLITNMDKDHILDQIQFTLDDYLKKMIIDAISVKTGKSEEWFIKRYHLNSKDEIICTDEYGNTSKTTIYSYYNIFNYFRLREDLGRSFEHKNGANYGYITQNCGNISYAELPKKYSLILGVTGTLKDCTEMEKNAIQSYNVRKVSSMPTFFGTSKLKITSPISNSGFTLTETLDSWLEKIYKSVKAASKDRAVLVFFYDEAALHLFINKFKDHDFYTITGREDEKQRDKNVDFAGVQGRVTLAIRLMGRGVDFKSTDSRVEKSGGIHVIQTFLSIDIKEEIQIRGRTARLKNNGSWELILCRPHLEELNSSKNGQGGVVQTYEEVDTVRKLRAGQEGEMRVKKVEQASNKHHKTFEFVKNCEKYDSGKRNAYLAMFPFVKDFQKYSLTKLLILFRN